MLVDLSVLDIDALINTLDDLGVHLTEEQRKYFEVYCRELIYADPQHAAEQILDEVERLAKKKLSTKDKEKLSETEKLNKWQDMLNKEKRHQYTSKDKPLNLAQARIIIAKASERLGIALNNKQREKAARRFYAHCDQESSFLDLANSALLNVIKVGIAGGVRIVVLYNWGNLIGVPNYNPLHGFSAVNQGNRLEAAIEHHDPLGKFFSGIMNILTHGEINHVLENFVKVYAPTPQQTAAINQTRIPESHQLPTSVPQLTPSMGGTTKHPLNE